MAARGTVTVAENNTGTVRRIAFTWLTDASGYADANGVAGAAQTTLAYNGLIQRVVQIPNKAGTQPTSAYDVRVLDDDGTDLLHGLGANLSNSADTVKDSTNGLGAVAGSKLTLEVTNGGNAKTGQTIVYIR